MKRFELPSKSPGLIEGPDELCRALDLPLPRLLELAEAGAEVPNTVDPIEETFGVEVPTKIQNLTNIDDKL